MASRAFAAAWKLGLFLLVISDKAVDAAAIKSSRQDAPALRERISLNTDWRFKRSETSPDNVIYDARPNVSTDGIQILKPWILPSANDFISDPANRHERPAGNPGGNMTFVQRSFDDDGWESVTLPHDWAVQGPFYTSNDDPVTGGMGRLPIQGVGWYRRKLNLTPADQGRHIYLDIDGAMSYAMVWLNGHLVGGWPYGYNSFRLDLTPYLVPGDDNQLAIRVDNPVDSSRWYPGGGLYRNIWLVKVDPVHVGQSGTFVTSKDVSSASATLDLVVEVENRGNASQKVEVHTDVHVMDSGTGKPGEKVAEFPTAEMTLSGNQKQSVSSSVVIENPQLWAPWTTTENSSMYVAVTSVQTNGKTTDTYETPFGIRSLTYDGNKGLLVNDQHVRIQGVNQHHDLGALGAAFNVRAAQRQLEILREMGCNAIRMSHNPPAPELLDLTDRMGFLVMDEIFDSWVESKTTNDFHAIFQEWHEPDLRSFMRRDRNHPSIFAWSIGNEVGEQHTDEAGAAVAQILHDMVVEEDPTRPSTASMNFAKPDMPFPKVMGLLSLNYQGEGIRDTPAYSQTTGTTTPPLYADFHAAFPEKVLLSSETAAALSSRGTYVFPVTDVTSAPVNESSGGNAALEHVSAYELYTADFGASADKVFAAQDRHPFVAGQFVWSGFDYIGEPTPYYDPTARSSYFGIVDLAGFPKDRFYLYQSYWRPDLRMAHILPHWNWPDRVGLVTPVHVFSSADEAELFLNEESLGRLRKGEFEYRFRWDDVVYQPGELRVITFKNGEEWATDSVRTTGKAAALRATSDATSIDADGYDLVFVTVEVVDSQGDVVRQANNAITFSVSGPGEIVATDNGDPTDLTPFPSAERRAFGALALAIVRAKKGESGVITVTASGVDLVAAEISITVT